MNTICPECRNMFDSSKIEIKDIDGVEGVTVYIFNCPICKEEINSLECEKFKETKILIKCLKDVLLDGKADEQCFTKEKLYIAFEEYSFLKAIDNQDEEHLLAGAFPNVNRKDDIEWFNEHFKILKNF